MVQMKILFVISSYEPARAFGGVVTSIINPDRALGRKGVDVTVYIVFVQYDEVYGIDFEDMQRRVPDTNKIFRTIGRRRTH